MTFSPSHDPIRFRHTIDNLTLKTLNNSVQDLGFTLTRTLCPNMHIENICCKAFKLLGLIHRDSLEFNLLSPLKALYCTLVRTVLEYGSVF